ncbi:TonB-dependent receptor plug domain-containing protein, partial [Steroidobacter sp.]|uniref:TonB-dependent receptor plug domain-containing protein n=1 Tax=Steroidobacter sp. TaxID=1978227 RepID=UPI001A54D541
MHIHKKSGTGRYNGLRAALLAVLAMHASGELEAAQLDEAAQFDITAQSLDTALLAFSRQAGIQVLATTQTLVGKTTAGVKGQRVVEQALAELLRGSGLKFRQTSSHAVTVELGSGTETSALSESGTIRLAQAESVSTAHDDQNISEVLVSARKPFTEGNMDIVRTENDAQPYQIIGKDEIEKSGAANVEDFLKKHLTMNAVARNPGLAAVSTVGTMSNVNLRGIGTNQTLILINGRRTATIALFGATNQPDVNSVPIGAVERIEVLPVSSSAIYGGSAIGGVINVVLKKNYEGGQVNVSYRSPFDVDAPIRTVDATYGLSLEGGRTHVMVGARYSDSQAPLARDRPELYARGLANVLRNNPAMLTSPAAPFTVGALPNIGSVSGGNLTLRPEYGGGSLGSNITHLSAGVTGATSPLAIGAGLLANAGTYDFNRVDSVGGTTGQGLRAPVHGMPEVKSFIATARRQMSENVEAFIELYNSTNLRSAYWMPASASYIVSAASPYNPFQQDVRVTLPALGERSEIWSETEVPRATGGLLIELPNDWQMETDYTWTSN